MAASASRVRLRQAVLVARELEPVASDLRTALGLGEPFRDPGVGLFGLHNAVFALGERFLEIVSPTQPDTAAGRYLQRHGGDGGYMVMFDVEDLNGARSRALGMGVRVVWEIDLEDISGTHLHPADMRGAIVVDRPLEPLRKLALGREQWTGTTGTGAAGELVGVTIAVAEPRAVAERWGAVLGVPVARERQAPDARAGRRRGVLRGCRGRALRRPSGDRRGDPRRASRWGGCAGSGRRVATARGARRRLRRAHRRCPRRAAGVVNRRSPRPPNKLDPIEFFFFFSLFLFLSVLFRLFRVLFFFGFLALLLRGSGTRRARCMTCRSPTWSPSATSPARTRRAWSK